MPDQIAFQFDAFEDDAFQVGTVAPVVIVTQPSGGGRRIPNTYESLEPRLARARKLRRQLEEERRRLALLKKQQTKVERQYEELGRANLGLSTEPTTFEAPVVECSRSLEREIADYQRQVALQNAKVRQLRKEAEKARRQAEDRRADEADRAEQAMEAYRLAQAQSEWERAEAERLQQEADDDEMEMLLMLVHEDAL